jgi:hypothetical protein
MPNWLTTRSKLASSKRERLGATSPPVDADRLSPRHRQHFFVGIEAADRAVES